MNRDNFGILLESTILESQVLRSLEPILEKKTWEQIAVALYQILDDIDTADDMFKEDVEGFRKFVMKKQAEKNQHLISDGFSVARINEDREKALIVKGKLRAPVWVDEKGYLYSRSKESLVFNTVLDAEKAGWKLVRIHGYDTSPKVKESLTDFAQKELQLAGLFDKDSDYEGMIGEAVMELIQTFAKQEHSGCSAGLTREVFDKLSSFKPLTEITNNPDEWYEVGQQLPARTPTGEGKVWQSTRCPSLFSEDGGKTYYDLDEMERDVSNPQIIHTSKVFVGS